MKDDWSIKIRGTPGQTAQFIPQGGNAGDALPVKINDIVSWGNDSEETHQPWPTDSQHNLLPAPPTPNLSDPIPPQQSSSPAWVVKETAGTTLFYRCKTHPDRPEFGTIKIET